MKKTKSINLHKWSLIELPESHTVLDIDGVLADFTGGFLKRAREMGLGDIFPKRERDVTEWDYGVPKKYFTKVWNTVKHDIEFWSSLRVFPKTRKNLTFKPIAYITHRPISNDVTKAWLKDRGFPVPERCYTVADVNDKVILAKRLGAKRIIDDRPDTCQTFIDAGLDAFVFTRPHNLLIEDVERIASLGEVDEDGKIAVAGGN
jgi:hypothetical protein